MWIIYTFNNSGQDFTNYWISRIRTSNVALRKGVKFLLLIKDTKQQQKSLFSSPNLLLIILMRPLNDLLHQRNSVHHEMLTPTFTPMHSHANQSPSAQLFYFPFRSKWFKNKTKMLVTVRMTCSKREFVCKQTLRRVHRQEEICSET